MEAEGGLVRCDCPRGVALAAMAKTPEYRDPVISTEFASFCVEQMACMPDYFPSEVGARIMIARKIKGICESEEAADWLVGRMVDLFRKWPGVDVMRGVYCSKHSQPLDGIIASGVCEEYPDGFPSERPEPEPKRLLLPRSRDEKLLSAAPELETMVSDLAAKTKLDRTLKRVEPPSRELTQEERQKLREDERKAVEELRAAKAREELEKP
jgi:hypothetical protein